MSHLATDHLIDAAATLEPADRALFNIWVNRGLDDAAVARMTGMTEQAIADRRGRIVNSLSAVLGLAPEDVRRELAQTVPSPSESPSEVVTAAFEAVPNPGIGPAAAVPIPGPAAAEVDTPAGEPETASTSSRRRVRLSAVIVAIVALVVGVLLISGGSGRHRAQGAASKHADGSSAGANQGSSATGRPTGALVVLPGGPAGATGAIRVTGSAPHLRLDLRVSNLPAVSHGHYEVWLYASVLNSEDLGRLRNGESHLSLAIPGDVRRYEWIDISLQPTGYVFHSGESVLRSANPLSATAGAQR